MGQAKTKSRTSEQQRVAGTASIVSLNVNGYRGLQNFEVDGLAPVSVFTGDNGSGKTRLLESAFAIFGRKTLIWLINLQGHRGLRKFSSKGPNFLGLFNQYSDRGIATISAKTENGDRIELTLDRGSPQQLVMFAKGESPVEELPFESKSFLNGQQEGKTRRLIWSQDDHDRLRLEVENGEAGSPQAILLHPSQGNTQEDDAQRFGDATASGMTSKISELLDIIDSRIQRVEYVPTSKGDFFGAHLNDGSFTPLGMLGGGVSNLLRYVLCLISTPDGFLGIDEIENGFFHQRLPEVFEGILKLRRKTQTQLMMATHSREALQAITVAARNVCSDDLAIVHLRRENGIVRPTVLRGEEAIASVELGYELR